MAATTTTKGMMSGARQKIPREIIQMFDSDPEFIHVINDDVCPVGKMVFPLDVLGKLTKLTAQQRKNLEENYDLVLMPKIR